MLPFTFLTHEEIRFFSIYTCEANFRFRHYVSFSIQLDYPRNLEKGDCLVS